MDFKTALTRWNGGIERGAQRRLAEKVGVKEPVVSKWASGDLPGEKMQRKVAQTLGVTVAELVAMFTAPSGVDMTSLRGVVDYAPVLGVVSAETFFFSFDAIPEKKIPNPYPGKEVFALRVSGDCMEPTLRNGDYIILSRSQVPTDGKIVLAQLDAEHTLKRYYRKPDGVELRPDNPRFKARTYATNKLEIVAVSLGSWKEL